MEKELIETLLSEQVIGYKVDIRGHGIMGRSRAEIEWAATVVAF